MQIISKDTVWWLNVSNHDFSNNDNYYFFMVTLLIYSFDFQNSAAFFLGPNIYCVMSGGTSLSPWPIIKIDTII